MLLSDAITDYVNHIAHERRLAKTTTVTGYASNLRQLLRWLEANGYPDPTLNPFTTPVLRRYLYFLSAEGLRPRTIRGRFHPIIGLSDFLKENGILNITVVNVRFRYENLLICGVVFSRFSLHKNIGQENNQWNISSSKDVLVAGQ